MPLPNGRPGVNRNPVIVSPYTQSASLGVNFPPPLSDFRITNDEDERITNDGDYRITNT